MKNDRKQDRRGLTGGSGERTTDKRLNEHSHCSSFESPRQLIVPNITPPKYPALVSYPHNGQWVYLFYAGPPLPSTWFTEGPALIQKNKLLILFNEKSEVTATGFVSPHFLSQEEVMDKLIVISLKELRG